MPTIEEVIADKTCLKAVFEKHAIPHITILAVRKDVPDTTAEDRWEMHLLSAKRFGNEVSIEDYFDFLREEAETPVENALYLTPDRFLTDEELDKIRDDLDILQEDTPDFASGIIVRSATKELIYDGGFDPVPWTWVTPSL